MNALKVVFILGASALTACAGAVTLKADAGTAYYFGPAAFFSPDGRLPYGKTDSAVKREVLDGGARILETVTQPAPGHGMRPKESVTELKRRKQTLVYSASDDKGTFSGTVTFKDPALKSWTYKIKMAKGGELTGSGSLSGEGIKTEKKITGPGRPMLVREDLKPVSEENYLLQVRMMRPSAGME
jgi:hypothetical protein